MIQPIAVAAARSDLTQALDRMKFGEAAGQTIDNALIALITGCVCVSVPVSLSIQPGGLGLVPLAIFVSILFGTLPLIALFVPLYALLMSRNAATYLSAALVASLISAPTYLVGGTWLAFCFASYAVPIALLAHFLVNRATSPNHHFPRAV